MTTAKLIYILTMGFSLITFGGITYLFAKQKDFSLLNGYSNRPEEEKEFLEKSGYLNALGKLFTITFWMMLITFIVGLFSTSYLFFIGLGLFTFVLLFGLTWIQRYEVPHKRKKMIGFFGVFSFVIFFSISGVIAWGVRSNDFIVTETTFEVTGPYSNEWEISEVTSLELLDELPEIKFRSNGISAANKKVGHFKLEEPYGKGLLYISDLTPPFLLIETEEGFLILNDKNNERVEEIYNLLKSKN